MIPTKHLRGVWSEPIQAITRGSLAEAFVFEADVKIVPAALRVLVSTVPPPFNPGRPRCQLWPTNVFVDLYGYRNSRLNCLQVASAMHRQKAQIVFYRMQRRTQDTSVSQYYDSSVGLGHKKCF